ncbi:MAG: nucleotide-binding protein [Nitrosopumilales archaeon]|nr:nucleotide-binding protein [Nitrosopumilales archaeon]MRN68075.1 nucleotide-binding protein [Nitrosopumilales archaeon]
MELSKTRQQEQDSNPREKFIMAARRHKILSNKCSRCGHLMLVTVYYCEKCFNHKFEINELEGTGKVVTYTIQAVAPEGFEDAGSYAWVVFSVDGTDFNASGFLPGVTSASDLPLGSRVRVLDYHPKHGLTLQKV